MELLKLGWHLAFFLSAVGVLDVESARPANFTRDPPKRLFLPGKRLIRTLGQQPRSQQRLELSTEFFLVPERSAPAPTVKAGVVLVTRGPCPPGSRGDFPGCEPKPSLVSPGRNWTSVQNKHRLGLLRKEPWVIPLLVFSALTMFLIAGFEVFVLCKAVRTTPSRRHLFLGQMLLLGLFLCAALGATLAATPTPVTCATVRLGTGVAYAIVFAALLVKCVFLISLNGGVYLPAPYQGLLLLFAVLIQIAVGTQWLVNAPPKIIMLHVENAVVSHHHRLVVTAEDLLEDMVTSLPLCNTPYQEVLFSLMYVMCLIVFVAILAIKSRGIRDNYREATFIGLSVGCTIPIWLVWVLCGLVVPDRHRDACLAYGLVTTSSVVFLVMFMPKGRQLAAMGKEGVYIEDREDRFSSLSRAGSGYSPSFFHFKPNKYGMVPGGGGPPITISAAQHKHQQSTVTTLADRVALVAPPPSYTRMYHYYPYCYYPRYQGGVYLKPEDGNVYTTLEPTLSANPNVFFQRGVHPGMMY